MLQPLLTTVIFTLIFGRFADFPSDGLPYPVFVLAGVLPWTYFATSLSGASGSIVGNRALVTRVYFPRLLLPLGSITTPLVDFLVAFPVLVGDDPLVRHPDWNRSARSRRSSCCSPLSQRSASACSSRSLNVRYRDVPYAIPFVIQMWMCLSPVIYPVNALEEQVPVAVLVQSDDGGHHRPALVAARRVAPSVGDVAVGVGDGRRLPRRRAGLLPARRAAVRGHDLMSTATITVERLSKSYRIGQLQSGYGTLRESLAHAGREPPERSTSSRTRRSGRSRT